MTRFSSGKTRMPKNGTSSRRKKVFFFANYAFIACWTHSMAARDIKTASRPFSAFKQFSSSLKLHRRYQLDSIGDGRFRRGGMTPLVTFSNTFDFSHSENFVWKKIVFEIELYYARLIQSLHITFYGFSLTIVSHELCKSIFHVDFRVFSLHCVVKNSWRKPEGADVPSFVLGTLCGILTLVPLNVCYFICEHTEKYNYSSSLRIIQPKVETKKLIVSLCKHNKIIKFSDVTEAVIQKRLPRKWLLNIFVRSRNKLRRKPHK